MKNFIFLLLLLISFYNCRISKPSVEKNEIEGGTGQSLDFFSLCRSFPSGKINTKAWEQAALHNKYDEKITPLNRANWHPIGPVNTGGRTLCMAFQPGNSNTIYLGSAGGGLWKSTTGGIGSAAWNYIETGFPVIGVGAIAISTANPNIMYIGTGEVYGYQDAGTGFTIRTKRGSYGIGILKSIDGGQTWSKSLDWSVGDLRGIQSIVLNPMNNDHVWAATSEGLYVSYNAGQNWIQKDTIKMAVDIIIPSNDTSRVYITHGSLDNTNSGIYRSTNGGQTFTKLTNGLPTSYSGKTKIAIAPSNTQILYASVADAFQQIGFFKTSNGGNNWTKVDSTDICTYQGWYSHGVAVKPDDPNTVVYAGIDTYISTTGGTNPVLKTYWADWYFGQTPAGGPEGTDNYVHADVHNIYFHPSNPNTIYYCTDGGLFYTTNLGETCAGLNGGYQSQQFYANFSNSKTDSLFAIGGLQDNATVVYTGEKEWSRVIGGDGMCTAISPVNDSIVFGASQYMALRRSTDKGNNFSGSVITGGLADSPNFNAPFEIAPGSPTTMYVGGQRLYRSTNSGISYVPMGVGGAMVDSGNAIVNLAISPLNANHLFISTSPNTTSQAKVLKTKNNGTTWTIMHGLPNRIAMDIAFVPGDTSSVLIAFSGFGSHHLYKTTNGGLTWTTLDDGLPNIPFNNILIDPLYPSNIYVGTDVGVFYSPNAGLNWQPYSKGLPTAVIAMSLSLSPSNRKLRLATHGNGAWESELQNNNSIASTIPDSIIGTIKTRLGELIQNVGVTLIGPGNSVSANTNSPLGSFTLTMPDTGILTTTTPLFQYPTAQNNQLIDSLYNYSIVASKNNNVLNGVTTFDLVLIQKHILASQLFDSPYQWVAADVNLSGTVTTNDIVLIRKLILHTDTIFSAVPSWRFIPSAYSFPANPLMPAPADHYFINLFAPFYPSNFDFVGVKMGDINGSASVSPGQEIINHSVGISIEDQKLVENIPTDINLVLENNVITDGFQIGFSFDPEKMKFTGFHSDLPDFDANNLGVTKLAEGKILISWNPKSPFTLDDKKTILSLGFLPLTSTQLSNAFHINKNYMVPEWYENGEIFPINLKWESAQQHVEPNVISFYPNPCPGNCELKIASNFADEGIITVYNMIGEKLYSSYFTIHEGEQILNWVNTISGDFIVEWQGKKLHQITPIIKP